MWIILKEYSQLFLVYHAILFPCISPSSCINLWKPWNSRLTIQMISKENWQYLQISLLTISPTALFHIEFSFRQDYLILQLDGLVVGAEILLLAQICYCYHRTFSVRLFFSLDLPCAMGWFPICWMKDEDPDIIQEMLAGGLLEQSENI